MVANLYHYTDLILFWGLLALRVWALADCATRKVAAFPAVDKLTKPAWLAMLVLGAPVQRARLRSPRDLLADLGRARRGLSRRRPACRARDQRWDSLIDPSTSSANDAVNDAVNVIDRPAIS